jgi:hypothetical protein
MWVLALILVGALLVTLAARAGVAPIARSLAQRLDATGGGPQDVARLEHKIELLEGELADLQRSVEGVQEEMEFVQRLLEDPTRKKSRNS